MKLIERYASACNLQIGKQHLLEKFYPLPFTRYITLQAGTSQNAAKNYPYYAEVIGILLPYLEKAGIKIVQLGGGDDAAMPYCHHTMKDTSLGQASYLLRSSLLHFGNDSIFGHRAGYLGIPLVLLWGCTSPANHSPYEFNAEKTIYLESHRWGRKAAFVQQENPLTIALIDPYDVARVVLKLLGIEHTISAHTHFIGPMYLNPVMEWVPDSPLDPRFNPELPFVARLDKHHDEAILIQTLQSGRKIHLFTKKPIENLGIFQAFKDAILSYSHELTLDCPATYVRTLKTQFPKTSFFSRLPAGDALDQLRFAFLDHTLIEQAVEQTREDYVRESAKYLNEDPAKTLDRMSQVAKLEFKTNKFVITRNTLFASYAHVKANLPLVDGKTGAVLDDPEFWADLNHLNLYTP